MSVARPVRRTEGSPGKDGRTAAIRFARLARFGRFALVGASGVAVNALLLLVLVEGFGWPVLVASLLSIEVSTLSNWALNRAWTWRDRVDGGAGSRWSSLGHYHAVAVGGMAIQWTVLGLAVHSLHVHYLVGSVLGVAAATGWNFLGNDRLAFGAEGGRSRRVTYYAAAFLVQLAVAALLTHPWDSFVFQKSVGDFLTTGVTPYTVAMQAPAYIFPGPTLPLTAQWYAYPPLPLLLMSATYAPAAYGLVTAPWLARILLKLPFLLGTLGFAWAARRLIATAPGVDPEAALRQGERAERWLLLNPLFLLVAGVWGQFEALLLMLLVLSVLALRGGHRLLGGLAYGGALLLKIFPLYLGPLLLVHLVRTSGWRSAFAYFGAAACAFAALTVPFLLVEPHGTVQQILLMHAERPPARFAPIAALYVASQWVLPSGAEAAVASAFGRLSFALTALVLTALAAAYRHRPPTERNLLLFLGLSMTGGLLCTKVFNEQYTLLPLGLLAVARFHPEPHGRAVPLLGKVLAAGTWAMLAASLLDNFHVLAYLPPDVAQAILHTTAPVATRRVAAAFGLPVSYFLYVLAFATRCILLVPFLLALRLLAAPVKEGLVALERTVERVPRLLRGHVPARAVVTAAALAALVALPLSAAFGTQAAPGDGRPASPDLPQRAVLGEVWTDWYNPTNDPSVRSGTWAGVAAHPLDGYYNVNARKAYGDLTALRLAGVDAVLVHLDPDYPSGAGAVRSVAESIGMPYALSLDVAPGDGPVALTEAAARDLRVALGGPGADWWGGAWHLSSGGRDVIALAGVARVQPGFVPAEHRFVLESYAARHGLAGDDARLAAAAAAPPLAPADLERDGAVAQLWRDAYAGAARAWWTLALGGAPSGAALMTDASLPALPVAWLGDRAVDQPAALDGLAAGVQRWATLQGPLAAGSLRPAWLQALWAEPTAVVVPWNDFAHARAVEPTREDGGALLAETARWTEAFHHPDRPAPAPPEDPSGNAIGRAVERVIGGEPQAMQPA
jgi:putative flippase GtrA